LPYVVIDLGYPPVGTETVFRYGATWDAAQVPSSSSSGGTTVRVVVRRADGSEQVARLGVTPEASWGFERLSATALWLARDQGVWTYSTDVDLPAVGRDWITVWVNPALTLATDYAGGKTAHWAFAPRCFQPTFCSGGMEPMTLSPAALRGQVSWGAPHDAFVASLGDAGRAALLAFGAREAGGAVAFPRFQLLAAVAVDGVDRRAPDAAWLPCTDRDAFEVLAETALSLRDGDTLLLQYGVQGSAECAPQRPGLVIGTRTPGCTVQAELLVDRMVGKLLLQPTMAAAACTR